MIRATPSTIVDVIAGHAAHSPDAPALWFEGRETSYSELAWAASRLAQDLEEAGLKQGARVGYLGKNSDRYFVLLYAVASLGAVLVPLNWRLTESEWLYICEDSELVMLFADQEFRDAAGDLARHLDIDEARLIPPLGASGEGPALRSGGSPDSIVFQVYTSGTTGRPKGAMLTHRNLLALREAGYQAGLDWFPTASDTNLIVLPVAHIAGTAWALFGLYAGGRIVIGREFDASATLLLIEQQQASHMLLAPAALRILLDHPDFPARNLSSLKFITYGASPMPSPLLKRALGALPCGYVQMYGMTEAGGGVVALSPADHLTGEDKLLRSAGFAMPGVEVSILTHEGAVQPSGHGELLVRSAAVMAGYWHRPEATAEAIDADGWLRTGDIGQIDPDGLVTVLDRAKDMIISGGENIYPAEVEDVLFGHPDIVEAAVFGQPSERWGEEPVAAIVLRDGVELDCEAIIEWMTIRLARFKIPRRYFLMEALPRNAGNKVLRRELRTIFAQDGQSVTS